MKVALVQYKYQTELAGQAFYGMNCAPEQMQYQDETCTPHLHSHEMVQQMVITQATHALLTTLNVRWCIVSPLPVLVCCVNRLPDSTVKSCETKYSFA